MMRKQMLSVFVRFPKLDSSPNKGKAGLTISLLPYFFILYWNYKGMTKNFYQNFSPSFPQNSNSEYSNLKLTLDKIIIP